MRASKRAVGESLQWLGCGTISALRFGLPASAIWRSGCWPGAAWGGALPPSLHMLGAFLALAVAVQGVHVMLRRARRRRASAAPPMTEVAEDAGALSRKLLLDSLPRVKPRNHFGLRGAPR